jgi:hypothetical protein
MVECPDNDNHDPAKKAELDKYCHDLTHNTPTETPS